MSPLAFFTVAAFGTTLAGGALPLYKKQPSRKSLWRFLSLGSGVLLSVTFMEILPEALSRQTSQASWGLVAAFLLLFALENYAIMHACGEVLEDCTVHAIGYAALAAMGLHSLIDGLNLASAFRAGSAAGTGAGIALTLHKLAEGLTLATLFLHAGFNGRRSFIAVMALALATPLGAVLGWSLRSAPGENLLLGFAAGCFLYIASADVLPRLHKTNDRLCLVLFSLGLLSGAGLNALPLG